LAVDCGSPSLIALRPEVAGLPGPAPLQLDLQREAEERPDEDDEAEHDDLLEGGVGADRAQDVGGDQQLQAEDDRAPQPTPEAVIDGAAAAGPLPERQAERDDRARGHRERAPRLEQQGRHVDDPLQHVAPERPWAFSPGQQGRLVSAGAAFTGAA
jgi:hypothetical protein